MVAAPEATPDTMPVVPTLAVVILLLLQAPPETDSPKAVVKPVQTLNVPVIADGTAFIIRLTVRAHPDTRV